MQQLKITIPTPCTADWSQMTAADQGKYCNACNTVVIDFTAMTDEQIKDFFISKSQESVCGHFKKTQLGETHYLLRLKNRWEAAKRTPFKYAALFVLGIAISLTGCKDKAAEGKIKVEKKASEKHATTGMIVIEEKRDTVACDDGVVTGKPMVEPE